MKTTPKFYKWFAAIALFTIFMNFFMLVMPLYLLQVLDRVITSRSTDTLIMMTVIAIPLLVSMVLLDIGRKRMLIASALKLDAEMSGKLVKTALDSAAEKVAHTATLKDLNILKKLLLSKGITAFLDAPWAIVFLAVIYFLHPLLGKIALSGVLMVVAVSLLGMWITQKISGGAADNGQKADEDLNQALSKNDITRGLGMSDAVLKKWRGKAEVSQLSQASSENFSGVIQAVSAGIRQALQVSMVGVAAYLVIQQQASSGILVAATILLGKMLAPVELFVANIPTYKNAFSSVQKLKRYYMNLNSELRTYRDPEAKGRVDVKDLVVRSPDATKMILKGFSFSVKPGEAFAIVGASGAGKTTLAKTLIGSLTPFSGNALIDNSPVYHWDSVDRSQAIGYLPQISTLFSGTVAENISRMQVPDEKKVIDAARLAGVDELIRGLSNGYETLLGANGYPLSAGEQQRIALARAVYGRPQIVVLDEPNASLDADGERALFVCMDLLKKRGITVIVITHRPGVLTGVDRVAVMMNGVITNINSSKQMLTAMQNVHSSAVRAKQKATTGVSHAFAN